MIYNDGNLHFQRPGDKLVSTWTGTTLDEVVEMILAVAEYKPSIADPGIVSRGKAVSLQVCPVLHTNCRKRYRFHFGQLRKRNSDNQGNYVSSKRPKLVIDGDVESLPDNGNGEVVDIESLPATGNGEVSDVETLSENDFDGEVSDVGTLKRLKGL